MASRPKIFYERDRRGQHTAIFMHFVLIVITFDGLKMTKMDF